MKKTLTVITGASLCIVILLAVGCSSGSKPTADNPIAGKVITSGPIANNLTVTLSNDAGKFKNGDQEFMVAFTDAAGKPVDVGAAAINFHMPAMGSMSAMNDGAALTTTGTPGVYKGKVKVSMAGTWETQITMEGPAGKGKANLTITAQ